MNPTSCCTRPLLSPSKTGIGTLCIAFLLGCAGVESTGQTGPDKFEFGLIGDQQYNRESIAKFPNLMEEVNRANLAFVVHVGDFKGVFSKCDDRVFKQRKEQFDTSTHPFIYTPGDNEWADCHTPKMGGYDTTERLVALREVFFSGTQSLGQKKLTLTRQSDNARFSKFRENVRWSYGDVLFVTLHMVGPNNNMGRTTEADTEYRERNAANLAWLKEAFTVARREDSKAVAIFTQANPFFEHRLPSRRVSLLVVRPAPKQPSGFSDFLSVLEEEVVAYGKTVVLLHGDSHYFRIDKPLFRSNEVGPGRLGRQIENFTRVETFGFPESHWVRVTVDPNDPGVFTFKQQIVDKNRFSKR